MQRGTRTRMRWPLRRFVVADHSMEPTLVPGIALVGLRWSRVAPGELRIVAHPQRRDFWLVKRVESVDGATMVVRSDSERADVVDSRTFGPVRTTGSYRVIWQSRRPLQH